MLQIDFSLQLVPYFGLQILKTLNMLAFGGFNSANWAPCCPRSVSPRRTCALLEHIYPWSAFIRVVSPVCVAGRPGTDICTVQSCRSHFCRKSLAATAIGGKVACHMATTRSVSPVDNKSTQYRESALTHRPLGKTPRTAASLWTLPRGRGQR
jgi:hypothetical protein